MDKRRLKWRTQRRKGCCMAGSKVYATLTGTECMILGTRPMKHATFDDSHEDRELQREQ